MGATIKDVSAAAGVSVKTVSRVLNKERYVRDETRLRVEAVMAALQFRPSLAARSLAGGRSFQVALIWDNPSPYYVFAVQEGVRARCDEEGVRMIAQPYGNAGDAGDGIAGLLDTAAPDGLILTPPVCDNPSVLAQLERRGVPYVRITPGVDVGRSASVFIDNHAAAHAMTRRLIEVGHRRIGFVVGHAKYAASAQRLSGYRAALAEAGIDADPSLVEQGLFDFRSGSAAAEALLALPVPPTAIFASSDDMAAGVLATAHARGLRVPEQLSIAGFDDTDLASLVWPPLTTIRQPTRDMAYAAADLLFRGADGKERRELPFELIERSSTAAPEA
jgi:LacI family transcriptional regulator